MNLTTYLRIDDFLMIHSLTGLDVDCAHHDLFSLCKRAPE